MNNLGVYCASRDRASQMRRWGQARHNGNLAKQDRPGPKWGRTARGNVFAVLVAVASLVPKPIDPESGFQIALAQVSGVTGLPREKVVESLEFLRAWRVLWIRFRGETLEVRFEHSVVMRLLGAAHVAPEKVGRLMIAHRKRREVLAPRLSGSPQLVSNL